MKWYRIYLSTDVVDSMCKMMSISERKYGDLMFGIERDYHLFIRDDCIFFADRLATCPVKASAITLDELNILLLNKALKD